MVRWGCNGCGTELQFCNQNLVDGVEENAVVGASGGDRPAGGLHFLQETGADGLRGGVPLGDVAASVGVEA